MKNFVSKLLFREKSSQFIAVFRILFGGVLFWEFGRLIWFDLGYVKYINTVFHFKYLGFEWVKQAPDAIMYFLFWFGTFLSLLFALGLFFRVVSILLFSVYTYLFLLDVSYWNNHYYLYVIFLFLFCFTHANRTLSIDQKLFKLKTSKVSNWEYFILKFQLGVVYIYGAISKVQNPDWFNGTSTQHILKNSFERNEVAVSSSTFDFLVQLFAHGGFWYDLLIIPILWFRKTFWIGVVLCIGFHFTNHLILNIGSFPWAMLGTLFLFYPQHTEKWTFKPIKIPKIKMTLLLVFILFQLIFPLRHLMIDGSVFWTSEGKVGGWHMMSGSTQIKVKYFYLVEESKRGEVISTEKVDVTNFLNYKQLRTLGKWPLLVPQFTNFLKEEAEMHGFKNVKVYAEIDVSRNGRPFKPIVDPNIDVSVQSPRMMKHNDYVLLYLEEGGY